MILLAIAAGGFGGAVARYWVSRMVAERIGSAFPWGTFAVNISGSLLLGILVGLALRGAAVAPLWTLGGGTGFLGAYTTFSTWNLESIQLADRHDLRNALLNLGLSTLAGLGAAGLGLWLGMQP